MVLEPSENQYRNRESFPQADFFACTKNESRLQGCANTLLNLASDPGREIEITRCGAVSVLLITALVASDSDETRHACTKAITNLLCEKQVMYQ